MGRAFEVRKISMAKTAAAKSKVYSRYGKEIYVAAKSGSPDPNANLTLRRLIEKAKKDQVPAHVIDRALDKARGAGGEDYAPARYEGFGPGGCMVIVDCLTDNNARTFADVRLCFSKNGAKIGAPGAVAHMFDHLAIFKFKGDDDEPVLEVLMEADVDVSDVECEDGNITVFAPANEFDKAHTALASLPGISFEVEDISWVPQNTAPIGAEDAAMMQKFMAALDDCNDVQEVYHSAELPD
ncbi:MAG: YebC/PmpR family DNA-binding transcriptional regulator [Zetaproteobacteria bacterium CG06_land_8_20_14_3_00_59_53]|nr:MAG: transcriptional regulator [Zetaproteobacteria bacterium CG2_30_59_37]PIO90328.1 MAG: YebC/PmpR family DNA-binding transcriptional regulator [Zetaproteobacteria bacterium CG23_combo_of_CG06-09_8_20_14_all_59_86]PIQ65104.1 MAG: YebC/PmpR family DNA-binding transcriptional regulator [Zetaproteobacteria bacterium CG11_big_fil_rev_8_21_14_0_20_59_439]PIU70142.1 MAG: YebC/PmpR family DNA-binding transcriptional regulator [Zetaproteobacteria bacterium CG06_land_8_20_14_3_00_59_53]PIU96113.1 MA